MQESMVTGRTVFALPAGARERTVRMVEAVREAMSDRGTAAAEVRVPAVGLPNGAARAGVPSFAATPGALVDSWRVARHLEALTEPGDTVVLPDRWGFGGMFALEQANLPEGARRIVWTVAGSGVGLEALATVGTTAGLVGEAEFAFDWEIVQYRFSDRVLAVSDDVVDLIAPYRADATAILKALPAAVPKTPASPVVWLPEPVSRRSQSGRLLRAIAGVFADRPEAVVVVGTEDEDDDVWTGTTWDVVTPSDRFRSGTVSRGDAVPHGHPIIVLGDRLAIPSKAVEEARRGGAHTVVPARSAVAALWAEAATWSDEDELASTVAAILDARHVPSREADSQRVRADAKAREARPDRARRVSVGVPVYRNVRYLDECVESILSQSEPVHEVLLIDDGSGSLDVDRALDSWERRDPKRIRVLRQANRGVCVARNHMISAMTGDAFLLVDHDDVLLPEFIRLAAQALRQDSSMWAVAAWTEFFGDYEGVEAKPPFDRRVGLRENPIISTAALVDMRVREEGIAFAPDLAFIFCEDWHYWSQIVAAGGRIGLVPRALVRHRVHLASGGFQRTELAHRIGKARAIEPLLTIPPD